ncbi:hypothetical protein NF867_12185 [Solitalea sp. MAHUQ-68]|uniref:Lipid/polyisoprenoid-binding YceI-like domain-containing protein n=1 Tax=Solitalea agri TaxID=2953739 RepID=A0A9X2F3M7_9SPHI|nr:hypothetical protein [Solitalea agri]MCO4293625.1 hypothetical protein [Solitalea agri]
MRLRLIGTIAALILLLIDVAQAQERLTIKILPESTIKITGRSSLGGYTFKYKGDLARVFQIPANANNKQVLAAIRAYQLEVEKFSSGNFFMNKDFRKVMKVESFPYGKIELISFQSDQNGNGYSKIGVTIAGVRKEFLIPYHSSKEPYRFIISGSQPIRFNDFGLNPKDASQIVEIKDSCTVELNLVVQVD